MIYTIYYVHDPMCSWCYAFKETFEQLKNNLDENIKIVNVLGGLAPYTNETMPLPQQEMIKNIWKQIESQVGTKFNYEFWDKCTPKRNTYLSCKAVLIAKDENKEEKMINAIQEAYYLKALNPSEESTLIKLAKDLNLNENFEEKLSSKEYENKLEKELKFRRNLRVNAFPTLLLKYKKEVYPINIKYNDYKSMLNQINNLKDNTYF